MWLPPRTTCKCWSESWISHHLPPLLSPLSAPLPSPPPPPPPRVLLSLQSIVNIIDNRDEDGWTALHAAVYWENLEAAKMLVKKGAGVNVVTKTVSGWSKGRSLAMMCLLCVARATQLMTCADQSTMMSWRSSNSCARYGVHVRHHAHCLLGTARQ